MLPQVGILHLQLLDKPLSLGGVGGSGDIGRPNPEELPRFELDPFPGRVADDAIETRLGPAKNGGKRRPPAHRPRTLLGIGMIEANHLLVGDEASS